MSQAIAKAEAEENEQLKNEVQWRRNRETQLIHQITQYTVILKSIRTTLDKEPNSEMVSEYTQPARLQTKSGQKTTDFVQTGSKSCKEFQTDKRRRKTGQMPCLPFCNSWPLSLIGGSLKRKPALPPVIHPDREDLIMPSVN
jgi:hypothetical protein